MRKRRLFFGLLLLQLSVCCLGRVQAQEPKPSAAYALMLSSLYKNTVPTISPAALAKKLKENPGNMLLLDTRTPQEFKVSHLRQARFVHADLVKDSQLQALPKDKTIVVYCSVGYRSERIGERLKAIGFTHVYNLYGGIFQWVNEGQPVENAQGPTQKVHAYSRTWGVWLQKGERVYE